MKERTIIAHKLAETVRLQDFLNAMLPRDDGMNDARSRDTAKHCVYERRQYAGFAGDSDVRGFKSRVTCISLKLSSAKREDRLSYCNQNFKIKKL